MLKPENLIIDEIYYKNNFIFKHVEIQPYKCNNTALDIKSKRLYKNNAAMDGYNKSPERLATDEEKAWLEHCIKEDKFVEYEEFMKVYKPQFIVGQWYKYKDWYIKFKKECSDGYFYSSEEIDYNRIYRKTSSCFGKCNNEKVLLTDLSEIQEFLPQDHPGKQSDIKQIQEECKRRFPIGCKFKTAKPDSQDIFTLNQRNDTYRILDNKNIDGGFFQGFLYYGGKYAELIETPEVIIPEYVECVKAYGNAKLNTIYKTLNNNEDYKMFGLTWKQVLINYRHLNTTFKLSTKSAYDLQNSKQQPLTPEQCYNTEIEVGDEVENIDIQHYNGAVCTENNNYTEKCIKGVVTKKGYSVGADCIAYEITWHNGKKCGKSINQVKLIKKANKNTTTTLNKTVDVSSPKVTDRLRLKVRNQTTVVNTEERIKLKLNHLKTIKIKQHVN